PAGGDDTADATLYQRVRDARCETRPVVIGRAQNLGTARAEVTTVDEYELRYDAKRRNFTRAEVRLFTREHHAARVGILRGIFRGLAVSCDVNDPPRLLHDRIDDGIGVG